jgi:hypothetical protein
VRVHLAGKHALELELLDLEAEAIDVSLDVGGRVRVRLDRDQIEELRRVAQGALEAIQATDHLLELGALLAEFLCAVRVAPNAGLLELALYFLQALMLVIVIKDTSSRNRCVPRDL